MYCCCSCCCVPVDHRLNRWWPVAAGRLHKGALRLAVAPHATPTALGLCTLLSLMVQASTQVAGTPMALAAVPMLAAAGVRALRHEALLLLVPQAAAALAHQRHKAGVLSMSSLLWREQDEQVIGVRFGAWAIFTSATSTHRNLPGWLQHA